MSLTVVTFEARSKHYPLLQLEVPSAGDPMVIGLAPDRHLETMARG